jgi:chromatin structure-remodeling complex subunit RSC9
MERGDKYRFEAFSGLAEALIEKILEVASLFYKVDWQVAYTEDEMTGFNVLNGVDGTPDILQRISGLTRIEVDDNIYTAEFTDKMLQVNEAALTLRNMMTLQENAYYASDLSPLRDLLSIVLNLPNSDSLVELKHYALDIAEQLTQYLHLGETDPLYTSLLAYLESDDRGAILTSLRAISRISMVFEETNPLKGVPAPIVQNIIDWTLVNDEELTYACLDFIYQYTAVVENVDFLLAHVQLEGLINQLVRLLGHGATPYEFSHKRGREGRVPAPQTIASLPEELIPELLKVDEPERSSHWLRCLFEEDPDENITQIALWQAYQGAFTTKAAAAGQTLLAAAEFIKNVSTTFGDKVAAQVQQGVVQKFIIKGIRMRSVPVGIHGEETYGCAWNAHGNASNTCREFFMSPAKVYEHILITHLGATKKEDGKFDNISGRQYTCLWTGCNRFNSAQATTLFEIANHLKVHLRPKPTTNTDAVPPPAKRLKPSYVINASKQTFSYYSTAMDDKGKAAGLPLSAILVLRNLARNIPKTEAEERALKVEGGVSYVDQLFKPVEPRLFEILTHNKVLVSITSASAIFCH